MDRPTDSPENLGVPGTLPVYLRTPKDQEPRWTRNLGGPGA